MGKKELMIVANAIRTNQKTSLKESLTISHKVMKLKKRLISNHITEFKFKKNNGEIRSAKGTLINVVTDYYVKGTDTKKPRYDIIKYFDLEKNSFRSFNATNLID